MKAITAVGFHAIESLQRHSKSWCTTTFWGEIGVIENILKIEGSRTIYTRIRAFDLKRSWASINLMAVFLTL